MAVAIQESGASIGVSNTLGIPISYEITGSSGSPDNFALFGNTEVMVSLPPEFRDGGPYSIENMPLSGIPWNRSVNGSEKDVADHENKHAWVGEERGNELLGLSVIPTGDALGWAFFANSVDNTTAAASMVNLFSEPTGTGGDLQVIYVNDIRSDKRPGSSVQPAIDAAGDILSRVDPDLFNTASEIIAWMGFVTGKEYDEIYERAAYELAWKQAGLDLGEHLQMNGIAQDNLRPKFKDHDLGLPQIPDNGKYTLDIFYWYQTVELTYEDGVLTGKRTFCPSCGLEGGGHIPLCKVNTSTMPVPQFQNEVSTPTAEYTSTSMSDQFANSDEDNEPILVKEGDIFSRKTMVLT